MWSLNFNLKNIMDSRNLSNWFKFWSHFTFIIEFMFNITNIHNFFAIFLRIFHAPHDAILFVPINPRYILDL